MIITVIGSGMMASALSFPLRDNGHTVRLVGSPLDGEIIKSLRSTGFHPTLKRTLPEGCEFFTVDALSEAMDGADLILGGVSSFGIDWFISSVIPILPENVPVISVTKGMMNLEDGSLISYPELYEASTDRKISFNAIGGPCTSYELADRDVSCVTFCGRDMELLRWIKSLFETDYYKISLSTDVRGVECAVAMKNAYALAVTLAVGLSYKREGRELEHYNSQAAIFGQSVREMEKMLRLSGEKSSNLYLGAGDLYVTVFGGRTRKIGTLLGQGVSFEDAMAQLSGITLESVVIAERTVKAIKRLAEAGKADIADFPLLMHVGELICDGKSVEIPWDKFEAEFNP